jgi:AAA domain
MTRSEGLDAIGRVDEGPPKGSGRTPPPPPPPPPPPREDEFQLLTIFDFLDVAAPVPLITGVLPASGEVSVLSGESNAFKSFLALDMLSCIAHGVTWHGHAVDPGPVVYVVTEGANSAVRKRYRGWLEDHGIPREDWGKVKIIKVPIPLNQPAAVQKLILTLKRRLAGVKLIVFDLLNGSMEGSDAEGEVANAWVRGTQALSLATTATQLHVTHSGFSDAKRSRGHSHLWGSFSSRLKAEGNQENRTAHLSVERHKDEDSSGAARSFTLEQIAVGDDPETTLVPRMVEGKPAKKKPTGRPRDEKRTRTAKYFLEALTLEAEGFFAEPATGFNGRPVIKVHRDKIRDRMKRRGWLDIDNGQISATGRSDFKRARDDNEVDGLITEQDDMIWRID